MLSAQVLYKGRTDIGKKFYWLANQLGYGAQKFLTESAFEGEMMNRCYDFWRKEQHFLDFYEDDGREKNAIPGSDILRNVKMPSGIAGKLESDTSYQVCQRTEIDWVELTRENTWLGQAGEQIVLQYEKTVLSAAGRHDLSEKVRKVADWEGYDILSYYPDGREKYIEVKTTRAGADRAFPITQNEVIFSNDHAESYHLYRLFSYKEGEKPIEYLEINGSVKHYFSLVPKLFEASCR